MPEIDDLIVRVATFAEMFDYPSSKQDLLQMANEQQFPDDILNLLEELPNIHYTLETEVVEAIMEVISERAQA
ncbi:MAG: DUF2795 domain-containing protein [Armatimonadetes bacterium]|jgi:hypothetical protein|nr:DUF2795 domain-containing protein [Armatimonadota bacterium]